MIDVPLNRTRMTSERWITGNLSQRTEMVLPGRANATRSGRAPTVTRAEAPRGRRTHAAHTYVRG